MEVKLILGCWGREENEFCSCNGVKNEIMDLTTPTQRNINIANHLDDVFKLFDKPLYNNVHTAIFNIQNNFSELNNPVFNDKFFRRIEEFCIMHVKCGIYLKLELIEA